jgi:hypothetical protein
MLEENRTLAPGAYTAPYGYVVFASTGGGDAYCFDLHHLNADGEPRIVLISHETDLENATVEEVARLAKPVASSLYEFLEFFIRGEIDEECIDE